MTPCAVGAEYRSLPECALRECDLSQEQTVRVRNDSYR
jgi:hypothetical protein